MPVLSYRFNVPASTPAKTPVTFDLLSGARFITELVGPFSLSTVAHSTSGFRLMDRGSSRTFIPEVGSYDNGMLVNPNEAGWAPILTQPIALKMQDQILAGPPYKLTFQFFNTAGTAIVVAGFVIVEDHFVKEDKSMIYEIVTRGNPPRVFMQPFAGAMLQMERPPVAKEK